MPTFSYTLTMQLDDLFLSVPANDRQDAIEQAYEKLLGHFADNADLPGLPEPITEDDLRDALAAFGLTDRASFQIEAAT